MANINEIQCLASDLNTGLARCTAQMGLVKLAIGVPKGTYVTNANMADPSTYILAKIHHDTPAVRWYPSPLFMGVEINNTEAATQSFGYGGTVRVGEDKSSWMFQVIQGDRCGYDAIRKFHKQHESLDFYYVDAQGQLMGHYRTVSSELRLYAYSFDDIYVPTPKPGTGSAAPEHKISFMFEDDTQLADRFGLVQTGLDLGELVGVNSVNLTLVGSVGTNGTVIVYAKTVCGGANMGDLYGSTLANVAYWILMNETDGLEVALTSVAYNATLKQYTIDPDQADANYDVGDTLRLKFEPVGDLVAGGIAYYETPTGLAYVAN